MASVRSPHLIPGFRLGVYEIEAHLGGGGFGHVYRARHIHLGTLRAIKVMRSRIGQHPAFRARFLQEARTVAALSHPNVVTLFDYGLEGDLQFIVMEYLPSSDLQTRLSVNPPLPPRVLASIALDIGAALDYVHRSGLIHRDIKPANILMRPNGHAVLTDFGIAQAAATAEPLPPEQHQLNPDHPDWTAGSPLASVGGTYAYMSPEQCAGLAKLTPQSDIYSFGITLYQMATGHVPFGVGPEAVLGHQSAPVPPVASSRPGMALKLDRLFKHALAKAPKERPQSAGKLATEFALILAPELRQQSISGWVSRHPRLAVVIVGWLLLIGTCYAGVSVLASLVPKTEPTRTATGSLGQSASANGVTVTALEVVDPFLVDRGSLGSPSPGRHLVAVRLVVRNNRSSDLEITGFDWSAADSGGHSYNSTLFRAAEPSLVTTLGRGQESAGYVTFDVADGSRVALLQWRPLFGYTTINITLTPPSSSPTATSMASAKPAE